MAEIKPFGALRYTPQAGELDGLVCPPYDIISEEERLSYLSGNSRNIIRLELPREGADPYASAGALLQDWMRDGSLLPDKEPGLYIYEEEFSCKGETKRVKGFVCRVRLEEFHKEIVLPHEETLSKAKDDRFRLMCATGCNFSSIYSLYFDKEQTVYPKIHRLSDRAPDQEFASRDGVVHRMWIVTDPDDIRTVCEAFWSKKLYIADGHHRYETALNFRNYLKERGVVLDGDHPANFVMMTLVNMEHDGLVVFPTHRIVKDLPGFDPQQLLHSCATHFAVSSAAPAALERELEIQGAQGKTAIGFYCKGQSYIFTLRSPEIMAELLPDSSESYRGLDVSVLHTLILERVLGIDKENMANQKNLIYTRDRQEAVRQVDSGEADCAFLINATRVDEIASVAEAGEKMPQKSTYFYPKLITGHVINPLFYPK